MVNRYTRDSDYLRNASDYDSALGYDTLFGRFKMLTISDKVTKHVNITLNDNILEIGGGTGQLALAYARYARNVVVTDINEHMINIVKQKAIKNKVHNIQTALTDCLIAYGYKTGE